MRGLAFGFVVAVLLTSACTSSSGSSPSAPQPQVPNLTGTWAGNVVLQGTTTRMTWSLTQTNNTVTGPAFVSLPNGTVLLNGVLSGTLSGSMLAYTIAVSPGGIPSQPACSGQLGGSATANTGAAPTLTGSYAVTSATCTTPFPGGNLTLTKQ